MQILIDTASIRDSFDISQEQITAVLDGVIKNHVIPNFVDNLEKLAGEQLKATRDRYIKSIRVLDEGRMKGAVLLSYQDPLVRMLEEGASAFDIKSGFSKSNKKHIKASGSGWYLTIPLSEGTPGTTGEFAGPIMPEEVYAVVSKKPQDIPTSTGLKSKGLTLEEIPEQYRAPKTRALIEASATNERFEAYKNKTSIYAGISRIKDPVTGQSSYKSSRRVSEKSDPNSWIHPGISAHNLMDKSLAELSTNEEAIIGNAINVEMAKQGFEI